jgi:phosphate transport system protein
MPSEHIVKSFDEELSRLTDLVGRMGGLAEDQLVGAIEALAKRDSARAQQVVDSDPAIDALEMEIDEAALALIALRQPMATDLRHVVVAMKIAPDLERIGDYAKNVAKRTIAINQIAPVKPLFVIPRMGRMVRSMIADVLDAFLQGDAVKAREVWVRDKEVDDIYDSLFRELLTYMMEDSRNISACTHLLFIAKNIERMGDLATNIAERVVFLVEGVNMDEDRPKTDLASVTVVESGAASDDDR